MPHPARRPADPSAVQAVRPPARRPLVVAVLALLPLLLACSGAGEEAGPPPSTDPPSATADLTTAPVASKHLVGRVAGRLPRARRERLLRQVAPVVDGWLDAAFAGGEFPRQITGAWGGFTPGAARRARADRGTTSLAGISERIDGVRVTKRAVRWTVLAPGGRPAGVTARLTLDLHTSGEVARKVSVRGRLALAPVRAGGRTQWRVFAYDLTRGRA